MLFNVKDQLEAPEKDANSQVFGDTSSGIRSGCYRAMDPASAIRRNQALELPQVNEL